MATYYIDPTQGTNGSGTAGSPFNSLFNCWQAIATAFNAATEDYIINCLAGQDTNAGNESATNPVILDPSTASAASRVLRFIATGANRHTGVRGTGYRLPAVELRWNTDNTNITLQLTGISTGGLRLDRSVNVQAVVDSCLFADSPENGVHTGGGTIVARNTAVVGPTFHGFLSESNNGTGVMTCINCTAVAAENSCFGFLGNIGSAINCYSGGNTGDDWNTTGTRTNCFSEDGTQTTSTAPYSTSTFTSTTAGSENLKLASGSGLIGVGVGPSANGSVPTDDFEGTTRAGTTTDVGFDQRAAGGGGNNIAVKVAFYKMMGMM